MWHRIFNIYNGRQVRYRNDSTDAIINQIVIELWPVEKYKEYPFYEENLIFTFHVSPKHFNKFSNIFNIFFEIKYKNIMDIYIPYEMSALFRKLINLFLRYLNTQFEDAISEEMIWDIDCIFSNAAYLFSKNISNIKKPAHNPLIKDSTTYLFGVKEQSKKNRIPFFSYMESNFKNPNIYHVANLLGQGMDPNQEDFLSGLPIQVAIESNNLTLFQLLLFYGADPRKRPVGCSLMWYSFNALDMILKDNKVKYLEFIAYYLQSELLSRTKRVDPIRVDKAEPKSYLGEIRTDFSFNGTTAYSRLITMEDYHNRGNLEGSVKHSVEGIFSELFKHREGDEALGHSREDSFSRNANKWIEVIFENNQPVGFFIFQVAIIQGKIVVITEDAGMQPKSSLKGQRLNLLMGRRLAYAIKIIRPEVTTAANCLAISHDSYQMMRGERCTPFVRSRHMSKFNLAIIRHGTKNEKATIVNDCYYEDVTLPSVIRSGKINFSEYGFLAFTLDLLKKNDSNALEFHPAHSDVKENKDRKDKQDSPVKTCLQAPMDFKSTSEPKHAFKPEQALQSVPYTRGVVMTTIIDKTSFVIFSAKLAPIGIEFRKHCVPLAGALLDNRDSFLPLFKGCSLTKKSEFGSTYDNIKEEPHEFWGPPTQSKL